MIRPYIEIATDGGETKTVYPPLQWNEVTSKRKMLTDCKVWMHSKHPTWETASINLKHHNYVETIIVKRR